METFTYAIKAWIGLCLLLSLVIPAYRGFVHEKAYREVVGGKSFGSFGIAIWRGFYAHINGLTDFITGCLVLYVLKWVAQFSAMWLTGGTWESFEFSPLNRLFVFGFFLAGPFVALCYSLRKGEMRRLTGEDLF